MSSVHQLAVVQVDGGERRGGVVRVDRRAFREARDPREVGPSASSLASTRFTPIAAPMNGGARMMAVSAPDSTMMGASSTTASGLNTRRSLKGRGRPRGVGKFGPWDAAQGYSGRPPGTMGEHATHGPFPLLFRCLRCSCLAASAAMASAATTTDVVVLKVEGAIDRPLLNYLDDRLTSAEADGAIVVLQLDTSGTLDQDGVALGQRLVDMDVPVIAFVGPTTSPTNASGAGAAVDVRLVAERGLTRLADGTAEPDRPGPPRSGVPGPRSRRSRDGSRPAARTPRSTGTTGPSRRRTPSTSGSPRRWRSRSPSSST